MKFLLWAVVLASPWETGWLPSVPEDFGVEHRFPLSDGGQRLGSTSGRCERRMGVSRGTGPGKRTWLRYTMGAFADIGVSTSAANVDAVHQDLATDLQDALAGFIEHRALRLRDERIAANVCVDDGEQDLCATSIPEIHRLANNSSR